MEMDGQRPDASVRPNGDARPTKVDFSGMNQDLGLIPRPEGGLR